MVDIMYCDLNIPNTWKNITAEKELEVIRKEVTQEVAEITVDVFKEIKRRRQKCFGLM